MTLRKKTLIIIGITLIALIAILYVTSRSILLRGFAELEEQSLRQNVERAMSVLSMNLATLSSSTADWAAWDDTYAFIENVNNDYIKSNLVDGTFTDLRLNFMLFVNSTGHVVYSKGFDLDNNKEIPIPKSFLDHFFANQSILQQSKIKCIKGIILSPKGPVLISSHPIVTSKKEGPVRGTLIMGRYLDSKEIKRLAETTHLSLSINRFKDSQIPSDLQMAELSSQEEAPVLVRASNEHSIVGYALLNDINGKPCLVLKVDMPRQIYKQGQSTLSFYFWSLLILGLAFIGITFLLLETVVLSRMAHLHRSVSNIGKSRDLSSRISITGKDELSNLASVINEMIEMLQKSQDSLRKSEEFNSSLLNNSPYPIIVISPDTSLNYVNPALERLTGFSSEELIGRKAPYPWWTEETYEQTSRDCKKSFQKGAQKIEKLFQKKNGERIWVEITSQPIKSNGDLRYYLSNWVEITERKRAVAALRESEEMLAGIVASLPDHMSIIDGQQNIVWTNDVAKDLFGPDLVGRKCYSAYHGCDKPCELCVVMDCFEDGKVHEHETGVIGENGNQMTFWCTSSVVTRHVDGRPKIVLEVSRNITHRKRAEEALRSERDKLQGVINALGERMYIVTQDFVIEYQNDILKERFGDVIGKKCHAVYMQSDRPCKPCPVNRMIKSGEVQHAELVASDGRSYEIISSPFIDVDGSVKAIELAKDVTDKKALEAEAIRTSHLASIGELAGGVAHEINNPVNGIINYAEILKDKCDDEDEDAGISNRIIKEGERIAQIVKNLLSFARDQNERHHPAYIQNIIFNSLGLVEKQILKEGIKLKVDVPADLPRIKARTQEVQQVILNIISNARYALNQRFSGPHKDKIFKIRGETTEIEGRKYVRTTFCDYGTGIPVDILDKIHNPFFSTKPKGEGTGLGLSISHGIIKNHGGRLWFESVEGEYTKAVVDLPVDNGRDLKTSNEIKDSCH